MKVRTLAILFFGFCCHLAPAQGGGEASERTPEELDAAFTAADAAREAAGFSNEIIARSAASPLADMSTAADLVFRGEVTAQSYSYDKNNRASTHTTFTIAEVLHGDYAANEITLVQLGGPSRTDDTVLMVSTTHYFSVGEQELLFLSLDTDNPVPQLQTDIRSRFRVFQDQVYNEDGFGVILLPLENGAGHRLTQSQNRHPDKRFTEIHVGQLTFIKQFSPPTGKSRGDTLIEDSGTNAMAASPADPGRGYSESVDIGTFSTAIKN